MSSRTRSTVSHSVHGTVPASPGTVPAPGALRRAWARRSPWLVIAVLLHVLGVALMSLVALRATRRTPEAPATAVVRATEPRELPPLFDDPPLLVRDWVPLPSAAETAPVELAQPLEIVLDAAAGRAGEITDETDLDLPPGIFNPDPGALANLPSGATGGTPIGVGGAGHRGRDVSAFSSRTAGPGGKGGGGKGEGGGDGPTGAGPETRAVLAALVWLEEHQSSDGSWDCDGFTAQCRDATCAGIGSGLHDVGVTGLALLAFLGAGHTHVEGAHQATVRRGLQWLLTVQDEGGCFGPRIGQHFLYDHACAALALAEAYGMTRAKPFLVPAQRGIRFVLAAQNPYAAWRYAAPGDGDNDASVTGWMVMALKSAKLAGLVVDDQALASAVGWLDQVTDPGSGRTGYTDFGGSPSRLPGLAARFPPENSESMTAVAVLCRILAGRAPAGDPLIQLGADRMAASLPRWSPDTGHVDFYYWYYGTLALFQVGGARWERWNEALESAVIGHQRSERAECAWGSWDPIDPWSALGGRVYATALNCLCMEIHYRYPRVFGTKK